MQYRIDLDRSKTRIFPERLEDYIGAENPVRFLADFVVLFDLHALGFDKTRCADTARSHAYPSHLRKNRTFAPAPKPWPNIFKRSAACGNNRRNHLSDSIARTVDANSKCNHNW
jgi:hypothetical protein